MKVNIIVLVRQRISVTRKADREHTQMATGSVDENVVVVAVVVGDDGGGDVNENFN